VEYTTGGDGYPAFKFTQESDFSSTGDQFIHRPIANFSILVSVRPDSISGGMLFAVVNPAQTIIQFGLEITQSSSSVDNSDIILYYTDHLTAVAAKKLVGFTVDSLFGNWSKLSISVKGDVVSLFLNCDEHSTVRLTPGRVTPLNFEPGSVCYLAQGGPTFGRKFEVCSQPCGAWGLVR